MMSVLGKDYRVIMVWFSILVGLTSILFITMLGQEQVIAASLAPDDIYDLNAIADTYVYEGQSSTNYGTAPYLNVFRSEFLEEGYALIAFDLSPLPAGGSITSATLELFMDTGTGTTPVDISISRVTDNWNELNVTWNTRPGDAGSYAVTSVSSTSGILTWDITTLV